jgi:hypothetical protein
MGIQGAHTLTYVVQKISIQQLYSVALFSYQRGNHASPRLPTIYVDASWIVRSCTVDDRVGYLMRLCAFLVESGFRIVIVCDGSTRHHSKRSTTKRITESFESRILLHRNNTFLMNVLSKRNLSDSIEERDRLDEAIRNIGTKITTLENKIKRSNINVGADLFCQITDGIAKLKMCPSVLVVVQAEFQADSVLAGSLNSQDADLVVSADSDLAALVGCNCYGIKSYKFVDRRRRIFLQRLGMPSNSNQKFLTYCSAHKLQTETFNISYRNSKGLRCNKQCKIVVPIDTLATKLPSTRANKNLIHSPPPIRPRKIDYDIDSTTDIDTISVLASEDAPTQAAETDEDMSNDVDEKLVNKKYRQCAYHRCKSKWYRNMIRIPTLPLKKPKQYASHNFERLRHRAKYVHRYECLKRIGIPSNNHSDINDKKDIRICCKHDIETINKIVEYKDLRNNVKSSMVSMTVPVAYDNIISSYSVVDSARRDSSSTFRWRENIETTKRISIELSKELGIEQSQWESMIVKTLKRSSQSVTNTDWENMTLPKKRIIVRSTVNEIQR